MSRPREIDPDTVQHIRRLLAEGASLDMLAARFGVNKKTIGDIKHNRSWFAEVPAVKFKRRTILEIEAEMQL